MSWWSSAAACNGKYGSHRNSRAIKTTSARPARMISSACAVVVMRPTAPGVIPASRRILSAKGGWSPGASYLYRRLSFFRAVALPNSSSCAAPLARMMHLLHMYPPKSPPLNLQEIHPQRSIVAKAVIYVTDIYRGVALANRRNPASSQADCWLAPSRQANGLRAPNKTDSCRHAALSAWGESQVGAATERRGYNMRGKFC